MSRRGIADLFPWYLNGTLGSRERQRVEGHLQECSTCREELAKERRIYEEMAVGPRRLGAAKTTEQETAAEPWRAASRWWPPAP